MYQANGATPTTPNTAIGYQALYGRSNRKGYIRLGVYYKMRRLQIGNRWKTQFVTLHREEVRRLEENQKLRQLATTGNSVQDYLESIENGTRHINSMHGVTL